MQHQELAKSFDLLKTYCEKEQFKGWDPYDGLNSRVFNALPLKKWDLARLVWIQLFKKNPVNLRKIFMVPKGYNPKGIALLLQGYCNLAQIVQQNPGSLPYSSESLTKNIIFLADLLISLQTKGYSGACWGYNFDWQARRLFLFPKGTPTVVATCFSASALFSAFEITRSELYKQVALSSADFVMNDLKRTEKKCGFLFSYSPLEGNNTVYNASLLGSKLLSLCYKYSGNEAYIKAARESIVACVNNQQPDGSWFYGELPVQNWIDSFHTGYNLEAIAVYQNISGDKSFEIAINKGFDFYISNFFMKDGTPKYYHNRTFPIDIHCPAQLIVTLTHLNKIQEFKELAIKVTEWTIKNMQSKRGYFYYQMKPYFSSKISYMRWSNAYMFYALSLYPWI